MKIKSGNQRFMMPLWLAAGMLPMSNHAQAIPAVQSSAIEQAGEAAHADASNIRTATDNLSRISGKAVINETEQGAILSPLTAKFVGKVGRGKLYQNGEPLMPVEQPCALIRDSQESHALKGEQFVLRDGNHESQWARDFEEFQRHRLAKIDMGFGHLQRKVLRIGYVGEHRRNGLSDSGQIRLPGEPDRKPDGSGKKFLSSSLNYEAAYEEKRVTRGTMHGWQICYADNAPKETGPWNYIEAGRDPSETCDGGDGLLVNGGRSCYNDGSWVNKRVRNTKWHTGIENPLDSEWKPGVLGYCYELLLGQNEAQLSSFEIDATGTKTKETKKATCKL